MAHRVVSDADAPPLDPGNLTLDALLHPLGKDAFLETHFRRRAVVVAGGGAARAAALFPEAAAGDVEAVAAASSSERLMLWDQRKAAGLCHGRDRGAAPSSKKRDADGVDEFVLEAGDVLYFPAGLYHEVESLDDDNVSLNVSLVAPSWAEVITSSLRHCLSSREAFRARATSGPGAADDLRRLLGELKQIVGQLDVDNDGDDDSDDDGEFVIDVVNDPAPGGMRPCKLDVNPLYAATMQHEIEDAAGPSWVIINGNYGGSELLEPAVRARLLLGPNLDRKFEAALRAPAGNPETWCVADAQNWEQRVKSELEASKQWYKDWGRSTRRASRRTTRTASKLQAKADEIPGVRLQTNNSIYGTGKPFKEFVTVKEKKPDLF
ncbi:hypothetical protein JL722_1273 [Aureococcus anophagefferens]|nr:hypothetical protein JL722_1273 [Aureococcus anophagefferens]